MNDIDQTICPNCGDEDTGHDSDWIYDYGYTIRICDGDNGCGTKYKIHWDTRATEVEIIT